MAKPLYVDPEKFDDVQREILDVGFGVEERNCIVQGCAGCGKSCIAMNICEPLCARKSESSNCDKSAGADQCVFARTSVFERSCGSGICSRGSEWCKGKLV